MAVKTPLTLETVQAFFQHYGLDETIGIPQEIKKITNGVGNSNFFVHTQNGTVVFTLHENQGGFHPSEAVEYCVRRATDARNAGVNVIEFISARSGEPVMYYQDGDTLKPVTVAKYVQGVEFGKNDPAITPQHCYAASALLADWHALTMEFVPSVKERVKQNLPASYGDGVRYTWERENPLNPQGWRRLIVERCGEDMIARWNEEFAGGEDETATKKPHIPLYEKIKTVADHALFTLDEAERLAKWLASPTDALIPKLEKKISKLQSFWENEHDRLPRAVVHGDFFADNCKWQVAELRTAEIQALQQQGLLPSYAHIEASANNPTGDRYTVMAPVMLDIWWSARDFAMYDFAEKVLGWALDRPADKNYHGWQINWPKLEGAMQGYFTRRLENGQPVTERECKHFATFMEAACMRFAATRMGDAMQYAANPLQDASSYKALNPLEYIDTMENMVARDSERLNALAYQVQAAVREMDAQRQRYRA